MKADPLNLLLDKNFSLNKKFYFISGNEISLIEKVATTIIQRYKLKENITISKIDSITSFIEGAGLFEDKKIFLIQNIKGVSEEKLNELSINNNVFIFTQENSQKIKKLKNVFLQNEHSFLLDCYELDKKSKSRVLNEFLGVSNINLEKDLYWFLIEKLDNKYVFLENTLVKILELNQNDINLTNIKKILTVDDSGRERLFFYLLKRNKEIIAAYREKVVTKSDVNEFYYYCKFFCQLIIDSKNEDEYNRKIPLYLFREKSFLIDIYRKLNSRKKNLLLELLSTTEKLMRKEGNLSLAIGLRFFMSIKKVVIS